MPKRHALPLFLLCALPTLGFAQEDDDEWLQNCRSKWNRNRATACEARVETIPARGTLTIRPGQNGAVHISAYEGSAVEVHARIQATAQSQRGAEAVVNDVRVDLGETISADGPDMDRDGSWSVSFVLYVPRNTTLDVRTQNGPIAIKNVIGRMELNAQNGPIQLSGVGGAVRARGQNGPLQVRLTGARWTGEGLDAETQNGPVQLSIPENYHARLEIGTINGPMDTSFPLTVTHSGSNWKRVSTTLGSGGPTVRVMTTNGPLSLRRN